MWGEAGMAMIRQRGRWGSDVAQVYQTAIVDGQLRVSAEIGDAEGEDLESICADTRLSGREARARAQSARTERAQSARADTGEADMRIHAMQAAVADDREGDGAGSSVGRVSAATRAVPSEGSQGVIVEIHPCHPPGSGDVPVAARTRLEGVEQAT
eukprot:372780-Pleurochrysis_carterae.AAC.1